MCMFYKSSAAMAETLLFLLLNHEEKFSKPYYIVHRDRAVED